MEKITMKIDGMHCGMCEAHVCDAVRRSLPKAKKVKASHLKGTLSFVIDDGADVTPAINRISETGYKVLSQEKEPAKKGFFSLVINPN